jgi:DNA adenine methylase
METVNDLDGELMTFWRVLRDRPTDLLRACMLTPHGRAELAATWDPTRTSSNSPAASGAASPKAAPAPCATPAGGTTSTRPDRSTSMPGYLEAYALRLAAAAERLHGVSLEALPALEVIARYGPRPNVLLYVDPPYLGTTRGWGNNYRSR